MIGSELASNQSSHSPIDIYDATKQKHMQIEFRDWKNDKDDDEDDDDDDDEKYDNLASNRRVKFQLNEEEKFLIIGDNDDDEKNEYKIDDYVDEDRINNRGIFPLPFVQKIKFDQCAEFTQIHQNDT